MKTHRFLLMPALAAFVLFLGCSTQRKINSSEAEASKREGEDWLVASNEVAEAYTKSWSELYPEMGSEIGYRVYDKLATAYTEDLEERGRALRLEWKRKLQDRVSKLETSTSGFSPRSLQELKIDLGVLLDEIDQGIELDRVEEELGVVPFYGVSKGAYYAIFTLLNAQNPSERKAAAVDRFHLYVRGQVTPKGRVAPYAEAAKSLTELKIKKYTKLRRILYPLRAEVDDYLEKSPKVLSGFQELLENSGRPRSEWEPDFNAFKTQVATDDNWVRTVIRPLARTDFKLPSRLYALALKRYGHTDTPEAVRSLARTEFQKNLKTYRSMAAAIASREGLKDKTPKAVVRFLKRTVESDPAKVLARYYKANEELSSEIERRQLATLPKAPLKIRVAGEAESQLQPVPHLDTPSLVGNKGERPEFIVPVASKEKLAFDDFSFAAAAKSLTAHEGRPGHDLQFSAAIDRGVSIIRANYAFNSVNVEGWALYAEWLMESSMSQDEAFALMMNRMMRNARMFLDPELHLGKITPQKAARVITEDVGMSPEWAKLELRRYMWDMPGQAPSYYYGYLKLRELRREIETKLGKDFSDRCFHDAILNEGLLPIETLRKKMQSLKCSVKARN